MKRANVAGIEAKIQRASDTLQALDVAITQHLAANFRVEGRFESARRRFAFYAYGPPSLPLAFSVIAGEIVHHLRSSLDHLVTELAAIGPGGGKLNRLEFPICSSRELFEKACKEGKIKGVSPVAASLIEAVQPYHWEPPELSLLMTLHSLDVIDKHRTPLVVAAASRMTTAISIDPNGLDVAVVGMTPPTAVKTRPSPAGTEVFAVDFAENYIPPPKVTATFPITAMLDVASVQPTIEAPVIDVLKRARDEVLNIVGGFFQRTSDGSLVERDTPPNVTKGAPIVP